MVEYFAYEAVMSFCYITNGLQKMFFFFQKLGSVFFLSLLFITKQVTQGIYLTDVFNISPGGRRGGVICGPLQRSGPPTLLYTILTE